MAILEHTIENQVLSVQTVAIVLELHEQWVESKEVKGKKASFRNTTLHGASLAGKKLQGVDFTGADLKGASLAKANLDNAIFKDADLEGANLDGATLIAAQLSNCNLRKANLVGSIWSDADLSHAILTEANLSNAELRRTMLNHADLKDSRLNQVDFRDAYMKHVNLEGALMHGARLQHAALSHARFHRTDLSSANLQDAICPNAQFNEAKLKETILQDTNLADADLRQAQGLMAWQLAGAKLLGAKLPTAIAKFEGLTMVDVLCTRARTLFLAITSGCLYSWITLANTATGASSEPIVSVNLPIIATAVPIWIFNVMAPIVLIASYVWMNLYLQGLWDALARLPSIFPDGTLLYEKVRTWLPIDIIQLYMPMMKKQPEILSNLEIGISIILVWWLVPITLLIFIWVNLPHQSQALSLCQFALFALALSFAIGFRLLCKQALKRDRLQSPRFKHVDDSE